MQEHRANAAAIAFCVLLAIVACAGSYIGGYYLLCTEESEASFAQLRFYRYAWQAQVFRPAAAIDSWVRGEQVETMWHFEGGTSRNETIPPPCIPPRSLRLRGFA